MSGKTDYATYLRIDALLDLQRPLSEGAHDEMLFIVVHQVYELWFKLILSELDAAAAALEAGRPDAAMAPMRRGVAVEELLIQQLRVLETMSPDGFMRFRDPLAPASGFQSTQFREIEALSGGGDGRHLRDQGRTDLQRAQLSARLQERSLYSALATAMRYSGVDFPSGDDPADRERRLVALGSLYRDHDEPARSVLHQLCELFVDHDETIARWRHHHALMAAREIGSRSGTGGSLGVAYLQSTINVRFFPELWEVRNRL
ncbi:MAG: tryptophan 2,3-dioxygenase [Candidatus Dormibacteraeota bacterium]|uniref:Tryptophan 2,3-dioxygenase n=1 Tax=Candidatus Amunia macphersoniae TaxID=3127014 RepID=A0A934KNZ9_9BACT|nr:tryptophan 2,3-dioxygenase [Candidatus Dormibacteraeota bacterium]